MTRPSSEVVLAFNGAETSAVLDRVPRPGDRIRPAGASGRFRVQGCQRTRDGHRCRLVVDAASGGVPPFRPGRWEVCE